MNVSPTRLLSPMQAQTPGSPGIESPFFLPVEFQQTLNRVEHENFTLKISLRKLQDRFEKLANLKGITNENISLLLDSKQTTLSPDIEKDKDVREISFFGESDEEELKAEIEDLRKKLTEKEAVIIQLKNPDLFSGAPINESEDQMKQLIEENEALKEQFDSVRVDNEHNYKKIAKLENDIKVLKQQTNDKDEDEYIKDIEEENEKLRTANLELAKENYSIKQKQAESLENMKNENNQTEPKEENTELINDLIGKNKEQQLLIDNLNEQIKELENNQNEQIDSDPLRSDNEDDDNNLELISIELINIKASEADIIQQKCSDDDSSNEHQAQECLDLILQCFDVNNPEEAIEKLDLLLNELGALRDKNNDLENENKDLQEKLNHVDLSQVELLQDELSKLQDEYNELQNELLDLSKENESLKEQKDISTDRINRLESIQKDLTKENEQLRNQILDKQNIIDELQNQQKELENEINKLKKQIEEQESKKKEENSIISTPTKTIISQIDTDSFNVSSLSNTRSPRSASKIPTPSKLRFKSMKQELDELNEQYDGLKERNAMNESKIDELEKANQYLIDQIKNKLPNWMNIQINNVKRILNKRIDSVINDVNQLNDIVSSYQFQAREDRAISPMKFNSTLKSPIKLQQIEEEEEEEEEINESPYEYIQKIVHSIWVPFGEIKEPVIENAEDISFFSDQIIRCQENGVRALKDELEKLQISYGNMLTSSTTPSLSPEVVSLCKSVRNQLYKYSKRMHEDQQELMASLGYDTSFDDFSIPPSPM